MCHTSGCVHFVNRIEPGSITWPQNKHTWSRVHDATFHIITCQQHRKRRGVQGCWLLIFFPCNTQYLLYYIFCEKASVFLFFLKLFKLAKQKLWGYYSMILVTTPAPTVRPPSRIAKRNPSSIAIGVISSPVISMLSPGITISTPSGRVILPVTSVVLK